MRRMRCVRNVRPGFMRRIGVAGITATKRRCVSSTAQLVSHVDVSHVDDGTFEATSADLGWGRVYGGQTMAQAAAACIRHAGPSRTLHQFSCHFLKGGDVTLGMRIETEELAAGRSFSFVHARALQAGQPILTMTATLQTPEPGLDHQSHKGGLLPEWSSPHNCTSLAEHMQPFLQTKISNQKLRDLYSDQAPIEMRPAVFVSPWDHKPRPPQRAIWMRVKGPLPDDAAVHQRLLTYISDWSLLETAIFPHDAALWSPKTRVASLSHTMHFHRPFRADEWLCHVMISPSASGARGFARGEFYTEAGVLVASTAQEGLMRWNKKG